MTITYDPKYDRTDEELQGFMLFSICAAGKNADTTLRGINQLLRLWELRYGEGTPFEWIEKTGFTSADIKRAGLGCYNHRRLAFRSLVQSNINLRTATVEELEKIYGIGRKTARFFILFTRENVDNVAVLDVHILNFLKTLGFDVPFKVPSTAKQYKKYEELFLWVWNEFYRADYPKLADFDYHVWSTMRQ